MIAISIVVAIAIVVGILEMKRKQRDHVEYYSDEFKRAYEEKYNNQRR